MTFFNHRLNDYIAGIQSSLGTDKLVSIQNYLPHIRRNSVMESMRAVGSVRGHLTPHVSPKTNTRKIRHLVSTSQQNLDASQYQQTQFCQQLATTICPNIGDYYGETSILSSINKKNYDLLLRVPANYETADTKNLFSGSSIAYATSKIKLIKAFIIVQRGECKKLEYSYTVKLVCGRGKGDAMPLLGAYCYLIRKENIVTGSDDQGLLELAGLYSNISGLCSYTKFGFKENVNLLGEDCYPLFMDCIPMSSDFSGKTLEQIIHVVNTNVGFDTHPICEVRGGNQTLFITLYSLLYFLRGIKKLNSVYNLDHNGQNFFIKNVNLSMRKERNINKESRILTKIIATCFDPPITIDQFIDCVNNNLDEMFNNVCNAIQFQVDYVKQYGFPKSFPVKMNTPLVDNTTLKKSSPTIKKASSPLKKSSSTLKKRSSAIKKSSSALKKSSYVPSYSNSSKNSSKSSSSFNSSKSSSNSSLKNVEAPPRKSFTRRIINKISSRFTPAIKFRK